MQNIAMQVVGKLNFQNLSNFDLKSLNLHFPFLINRFVSGTFEISRKFESNKNKSGMLLVELNNIFLHGCFISCHKLQYGVQQKCII